MWLTIRRRWLWAALAGSLAFLARQPLVIYPAIAALGLGGQLAGSATVEGCVSSSPRRRGHLRGYIGSG